MRPLFLERFLHPLHIHTEALPAILARRTEAVARIDVSAAASPEPPAWLTLFYHQREAMQITREGIALIEACGVLGRGLVPVDKWLGDTDYDDVIEDLREALEDPSVRGIVLCVDSPGGSVVGAQECREAVQEAARLKPVVAVTHGMMTSAAYEISAAASLIIASPSSLVGSIGTITRRVDLSGYYEQMGVKIHVLPASASDLKAMYDPQKPMDDAERAEIVRFVDRWNEDFRAFVRIHRLDVEDDTMRGQCFDAREGVERGLIDALGSFDDALRECAVMAER